MREHAKSTFKQMFHLKLLIFVPEPLSMNMCVLTTSATTVQLICLDVGHL